MLTAKHDEFLSFLMAYAKSPKLIPPAYDMVRPFFGRADEGSYDLVPQAMFDPIVTGRTIAVALGVKVIRLATVSREGLLAGHGIDHELAARKFHGTSLSDRLMDRYSEELGLGLRSALREILFERLSSRLVEHLRLMPHEGRTPDIYHAFRRQLYSSVGETMYFYLGLAMAGNKRQMAKLAPLVEMLLKVIPVGEPADGSFAWTVLVA